VFQSRPVTYGQRRMKIRNYLFTSLMGKWTECANRIFSMENDVLIAASSWEPRFVLGFERSIQEQKPRLVLLYVYSELQVISEPSRNKVRTLCRDLSIELQEVDLSYQDPGQTWINIYRSVTARDFSRDRVRLDITTMPRETIWTILSLVQGRSRELHWVYHKPAGYNQDWLTRDPGKPRLVPKLGGVTRFGLPTRLLVLTGYDPDRTRQIINFYEPEAVLLGIQSGEQFGNQKMNVERHRAEFASDPTVTLFEFDAFLPDQGFNQLRIQLSAVVDKGNFILSSLGPKPSSISLYRLQMEYPQFALAYAPSREFNKDYSHGISETLKGVL
jgi:hypothetical protein